MFPLFEWYLMDEGMRRKSRRRRRRLYTIREKKGSGRFIGRKKSARDAEKYWGLVDFACLPQIVADIRRVRVSISTNEHEKNSSYRAYVRRIHAWCTFFFFLPFFLCKMRNESRTFVKCSTREIFHSLSECVITA